MKGPEKSREEIPPLNLLIPEQQGNEADVASVYRHRANVSLIAIK